MADELIQKARDMAADMLDKQGRTSVAGAVRAGAMDDQDSVQAIAAILEQEEHTMADKKKQKPKPKGVETQSGNNGPAPTRPK